MTSQPTRRNTAGLPHVPATGPQRSSQSQTRRHDGTPRSTHSPGASPEAIFQMTSLAQIPGTLNRTNELNHSSSGRGMATDALDRARQRPAARAYLEVLLVALATMRPDLSLEIEGRTDRRCLSAAAAELLDAIVHSPADAWTWLPELAETPEECRLAHCVHEVAVWELTMHSIHTLIELVNALPHSEGAPARKAA